jgi:hypothetical protein
MVMAFKVNQTDPLWDRNWPSPIVFHDSDPGRPFQQEPNYLLDPDNVERVYDERMRVFGQLYNSESTIDPINKERYMRYFKKMPKFTYQHTTKKTAGQVLSLIVLFCFSSKQGTNIFVTLFVTPFVAGCGRQRECDQCTGVPRDHGS